MKDAIGTCMLPWNILHGWTAQSFALNWSSVTPLPMAAVEDTPPVTVFMRLSM